MTMTYLIINSRGTPLSRFAFNDMVTKNQLKFSPRHWMTFPTKKEAEKQLKYIRKECRQKDAAKKLKIRKASR